MVNLVHSAGTPDAPGMLSTSVLTSRLDDLFESLGIRITDGNEDAVLFAELAAGDELMPVDHRNLAEHYAAVAAAPDPLAPGLMDDAMRRALNRLGQHGNRRLRQFGRRPTQERGDGTVHEPPPDPESAAAGTAVEEPPLLDRLEADLALLREVASRLAHYHGSLGPHKGRPADNLLDTVLVALADLFIDLVGFKGHPGQMTPEVQRAFLSFTESALEPYGEQLGGTAREALKKRWARLCKQHLSICS